MNAAVSSASWKKRFKSPSELLVGAARSLQLPYDSPRGYVQLAAKLGQDLFDPPNVKGWKGSSAWISSESLLSRWEVMEDFTRGKVASSGLNGRESQPMKPHTKFVTSPPDVLMDIATGSCPSFGR